MENDIQWVTFVENGIRYIDYGINILTGRIITVPQIEYSKFMKQYN